MGRLHCGVLDGVLRTLSEHALVEKIAGRGERPALINRRQKCLDHYQSILHSDAGHVLHLVISVQQGAVVRMSNIRAAVKLNAGEVASG